MSFTSRNGKVSATSTGIVWRYGEEVVRVDAWGNDSVRVRCALSPELSDELWALERNLAKESVPEVSDGEGRLQNGRIRVTIDRQGTITFFDIKDRDKILLKEIVSPRAYADHGRQFVRREGERVRASVHFDAHENERLYGLGQHQHGLLDQRGASVELEQKNTEVAVPFLLSTRGYGFLWNNPAKGRVNMLRTRTSWYADRIRQIDYVVFAGATPGEILARYTEATGRSPMMPEYAAGFWQCKLRYQTQEELLNVAREHNKRGLPLSVIVIDFFHWTKMGEWRFDPEAWPDPDAMVRELAEMGVEVMVSVWPTVNPDSEHAEYMKEHDMLLGTERGLPVLLDFADSESSKSVHFYYYDPSVPDARNFVWERIKESYYDRNIRIFWLDACEPEVRPQHLDNMRMTAGNMEEVGCIYPMLHHQAFYEGMKSQGQDEVLNLTRSAWAGSQRYGAAVWSGDIDSSFEAFRRQIPAGLNMALSGFPWWTTDIGGFYGGNTGDDGFRELVVRWFQYALFCPIFRLHGFRDSWDFKGGGPNEVWSFGDEAYQIISRLLFVRERMKPYIMQQMKVAHETGLPPMRPLFVDFPGDSRTYDVEDQFMFGPDILVAPVLHQGQTSRMLYLPAGTRWASAWDRSEVHDGGQSITVGAPLDTIPVFLREGAEIRLDDV